MGEIANLKQLRITRRWQRKFKYATQWFMNHSLIFKDVHAELRELNRAATRAYFQKLNNEINTYLWKKSRNWVR